MSDNIQEAEVGSGTKVADTKQSEKRAQLTLKAIQLRLKQEKERAALQAQKKSLSVKEDIGESFSPSQIAALKAEYSKINGIDPDSDTYKKLIAMLDRLDLKTLKSLAGAEIKFVSKLAQNRVLRKSMKKEDVQLDENEDLANARKMYHKHFVAAMKAMPSSIVQKRHQDEMEKYKKIMGNSFIDQVAPSKFAKFDKKIKEEVELDEKKKLPGLWANIHAKRKRGEAPAKPGDENYPKTLNIEDANPCWTGYKRKPGTKKFEPGSCVKEGVQDDPKADQMTTDDNKFPKKSRKAAIVKSAAKKMPAEDQFQAKPRFNLKEESISFDELEDMRQSELQSKSRKSQVVKTVEKKMPAEDQFQAKPVLDSQVAQQTNK